MILNTVNQVEKLAKSLGKISLEVESENTTMKTTESNFEQVLTVTMHQNNKMQDELEAVVNVVSDLGNALEEVALAADSLTMITNEMN